MFLTKAPWLVSAFSCLYESLKKQEVGICLEETDQSLSVLRVILRAGHEDLGQQSIWNCLAPDCTHTEGHHLNPVCVCVCARWPLRCFWYLCSSGASRPPRGPRQPSAVTTESSSSMSASSSLSQLPRPLLQENHHHHHKIHIFICTRGEMSDRQKKRV